MSRVISRFFEHEVAGGLVIMFAALAALLVRNSPWESVYGVLLELPVAAAVGGMIAPAAIYMLFNGGDELAMRGWAIPTEVRAQVGGARDPRRGGVCAGLAGYAVLHWWAAPATGDAVSGASTG